MSCTSATWSFCGRCGPVFLLGGEPFGCRPLEPGWARFTLEIADLPLAQASASLPTPCGEIIITRNGRRASVQIPANTIMVCNGKEITGPATWENETRAQHI